MRLFPGRNNQGNNSLSFFLFLILIFIIFILVIYLVFPSFLQNPGIRKIPIIPGEEPPDEVRHYFILFQSGKNSG